MGYKVSFFDSGFLPVRELEPVSVFPPPLSRQSGRWFDGESLVRTDGEWEVPTVEGHPSRAPGSCVRRRGLTDKERLRGWGWWRNRDTERDPETSACTEDNEAGR